MQKAHVPLVSSVIPRIDALVHVIEDFKDNRSKHSAVCSAAARGVAILNKYYAKTDESIVYRVAMGMSCSIGESVRFTDCSSIYTALDPRFKVRYFHDEEWLEEWINTAKNITREVYNDDYCSPATLDLPGSPEKPSAPSAEWSSLLRMRRTKAAAQVRDELATFWASPREPLDIDPLQFWHGALISRPESRLARIAIDYISAPASSADIERAFSRGALTVAHRRHALSDVSTRNAIVVGTWLKDTNLVPKDALIEHFQNKSTRLLTSGSDSGEMDVDNSNDSSDSEDTD